MFPKLTSAQLTRLERQGTRIQTRAGEILVDVGAPPRGVFVVAAGSVEALAPPSAAQAASGYELLYLLSPGDFTGEMSTLRGTPSLVRIRVREAGAVLLIDAEQLRRIVQNDAELSELFCALSSCAAWGSSSPATARCCCWVRITPPTPCGYASS